MKKHDIAELRRLLVPVVNCHAERLKIGSPTNRDKLLYACVDQLGSLLDAHEKLQADHDANVSLLRLRDESDRMPLAMMASRIAAGMKDWNYPNLIARRSLSIARSILEELNNP